MTKYFSVVLHGNKIGLTTAQLRLDIFLIYTTHLKLATQSKFKVDSLGKYTFMAKFTIFHTIENLL